MINATKLPAFWIFLGLLAASVIAPIAYLATDHVIKQAAGQIVISEIAAASQGVVVRLWAE
jgi:hypothetical protein